MMRADRAPTQISQTPASTPSARGGVHSDNRIAQRKRKRNQSKEKNREKDYSMCANEKEKNEAMQMSREFLENRIREMLERASYNQVEFIYWMLIKK